MKHLVLIIPLLCFTVLLAACTSFSTAPASKFIASEPAKISGLFYYLPEGRIHAIGVAGKDSTAPFTITISADITPDFSAAYYVKRDANYFYDDSIDLKTDGNGLLSTGNATSTDETVKILGDAVSYMSLYSKNLVPTPETKELHPFDIIFYPKGAVKERDPLSNPLSFESAAKHLNQCGFLLVPPPVDMEMISKETPVVKSTGSGFSDGLAFRLAKAYPVSIVSLSSVTTTSISASRTLLLPDKAHTYFLDYSRMPFVAKKTNLGFTSGMLTEVSQDVPSPIAGFIGIPKAIVQAIVPLPLGSSAPSSNSAGKSTTPSK